MCKFPSSVLSNDCIEIVLLYNPGPNGKALHNECGSCLLAVVRSTNVENVRAFPDVNPIANRAGRGALRPWSQALLKPQVPGARGLFSSDTEEDDLFGTNPPPLNSESWIFSRPLLLINITDWPIALLSTTAIDHQPCQDKTPYVDRFYWSA